MAEKKEVKRFTTPEGRLINSAFFEKEQFNEKATPAYKLEMAFEPGALDELIDEAFTTAGDKWGEVQLDLDGGKVVTPILDGDALAAKRAEKGKLGDAYAGKQIIRASTIYAKSGQDGPGGIAVYGPDVSEITAVNRDEVYNGCFGVAGLTIGTYTDNDGKPALKFYLVAFQKTRDGEKLFSAPDHSTLFKPVGRSAAAAGGAAPQRRQRKG